MQLCMGVSGSEKWEGTPSGYGGQARHSILLLSSLIQICIAAGIAFKNDA